MAVSCTTKPIIGILAQEISRIVIPEHLEGNSYIAASYVKHMEAAGADVVPIPLDSTEKELEELFDCINGLLIPGGGASLIDSKFMKNTRFLVEKSKTANDDGDYFPVWGTCLGFEAFLVITAGIEVLDDADAIDIPMHLEFTEDAKKCRIFEDASSKVLDVYANLPVTYNNHCKCITMDTFLGSANLMSEYKVISYNSDRNDKKFISSIEGHKYPFYGVQWHPEKVKWEATPGLAIPTSDEAVLASEFLAEFFIEEARKNQHRLLSSEKTRSLLIGNHSTVDTGDLGRFKEAYLFD